MQPQSDPSLKELQDRILYLESRVAFLQAENRELRTLVETLRYRLFTEDKDED